MGSKLLLESLLTRPLMLPGTTVPSDDRVVDHGPDD